MRSPMLDPYDSRRNSRAGSRSEEHTSELQSRRDLVCRLLLEKKKKRHTHDFTSQGLHILLNSSSSIIFVPAFTIQTNSHRLNTAVTRVRLTSRKRKHTSCASY